MICTKEMFDLVNQWVHSAGYNRTATIRVNVNQEGEDEVWCYDSNIGAGFFVYDEDSFNIDLVQDKREKLQKELEALNG